MRGLWSTMALVVVLAGLGGYIFFVDSERPASSIEEKQKVFTVEADTIEEITLTAKGETSTLRKVDGTWKMAAPAAVDADQGEVTSLASSLSSLEINRVVDENVANLAEFGLEPPRIVVSFKGANGVAGQINFGDKTATQSDLYAARPGEKRVFVVSAFQESTFAKASFDLRDKRILNFERDKVDSIELAGGASPIVLARSGSEWSMKQPVPARADYSAVEGLLTRLSSGNMTKLVEGAAVAPAGAPAASSLAQYGLDKPAVTVTLGAGSARTVFQIGKEEDSAVYARDAGRGLVFTVDAALATDLKKPADDYRDKDLFELRSFNTARLRITRGAETFEFQKVPGTGENAAEKWQRVVAGGPATDVDQTKMDDLINKMTALRAQSMMPTIDKTGLDKPSLVIAASYDQGKFERVRFGTPNADAFAQRDGEAGAAKLDSRAFDEMTAAFDALIAPPAPATPPPPPAK